MKRLVLVLAMALDLVPATEAQSAPPARQGKLYVTAWFGGVVSVVDVASRKVGIQDHDVFLSPDQSQA